MPPGGVAGPRIVRGAASPGAASLRLASTPARPQGLSRKLGPEFAAALAENAKEHKEDCRKSCEKFYCGAAASKPWKTRSISMGPLRGAETSRYILLWSGWCS